MPTRLILDTDIGTDVDDSLAIAVLLASPEIQLDGITCVYGDVGLRARMVRKLLRLAGRERACPVLLGVEPPLLGLRPVYWAGHEGVGLLEPGDDGLEADPGHAVDFMVETIMASPGEIHLLAIGPLTNVALAFRREPRIATALRHLTIMGGVHRGIDGLGLPIGEHNFICDPEAAHVVLSSGAPITLVPLDVTTKVEIDREMVARIRAVGTPFHDAVAGQVEAYPRFARRGATALHDPLAAAIVVQPLLVDTAPLVVQVETGGRLAVAASFMSLPTADLPATANVALGVDVTAAKAFIGDRLASRTAVGTAVVSSASGARPGPNPSPGR